jgi:hypothetical protein
MLFSLADEDTANFALKLPATAFWTTSEATDRIETIQRRLNSRCRGLIEISREIQQQRMSTNVFRSPTVQYLHKAVKDYIQKPNVQRRFLESLKTPFDPHLRLCSANLAMFKVEDHSPAVSDLENLSGRILNCMRHASRVLTQNVPQMLQVLDELEESIIRRIFSSTFWSMDLYSQIAKMQHFPDDGRANEPNFLTEFELFGNTFLSLAVKCEVVEYVKARAEKGCCIQHGRFRSRVTADDIPSPQPYIQEQSRFFWRRLVTLRRLSAHVAEETRTLNTPWQLLRDATPSASSNALMVSVLLEKGADPNFRTSKIARSIWEITLAVIIRMLSGQLLDPERKSTWLDIAQLMIAQHKSVGKISARH